MSWLDIGSWLDGLGQLDPAVIYLVIGGLALLESAALVGLFVPGETAVLLGGVLAHEGHVNVVAMVLVVALGATLGDSISYEIGRKAGPWLGGSRLGRVLGADRLDAGARYLERRGAKAIFFGRFIAVVRTGVPLLAGVSRMRYRSFLSWNVLGAVLWAALHVSIGYGAGASRDKLESVMHSAGLVAIGVIVVVGVVHVLRTGRAASGHDDLVVANFMVREDQPV
jgi:membrane protein DedA with SNARE-associated domain